MFWNKKAPQETKPSVDPVRDFEMAKEATRRAAFLNTAAKMPGGGSNAADLETLFRICRTMALTAGAAIGQSAEQVDAAIAAQCDADVIKLGSGSDEDVREFSRESGEVVSAFLATLDERTLTSAAQG